LSFMEDQPAGSELQHANQGQEIPRF